MSDVMSNKGTIYCIENKVNSKKYIGKTIEPKVRYYNHFKSLADNNHYNKYLQRSYNKYGKCNFTFKIIEENIKKDNLSKREKYWIKYYNTYKGKGYNLTIGGEKLIKENNPMWSKELSQEAKNKISQSLKQYHSSMDNDDYSEKFKESARKRGRKNRLNITKEKVLKIIKEYYTTNTSRRKLSDKYGFCVGGIIKGNHWAYDKYKEVRQCVDSYV